MDKTDRLRDYGLAFLLYEQGLGLCGYELIRELFIFVKLILNSYLVSFQPSVSGEGEMIYSNGPEQEELYKKQDQSKDF